VAFRPNLLATTSFDGSIATTYKRTVTDTVCDNTRELALSEAGQEVKVKHSRNSHAQLAPARHALAMVHALAEDFAAEVAALCAMPVSPAQWGGFLDRHVPRTDASTSRPLEGRALTHADSKRSRLDELYQHDPRVAPWTGTAHGVLQAVSTYSQHEGVVRGDRAERNSLKTITGEFADVDPKPGSRSCQCSLPPDPRILCPPAGRHGLEGARGASVRSGNAGEAFAVGVIGCRPRQPTVTTSRSNPEGTFFGAAQPPYETSSRCADQCARQAGPRMPPSTRIGTPSTGCAARAMTLVMAATTFSASPAGHSTMISSWIVTRAAVRGPRGGPGRTSSGRGRCPG